jgi:hypothetical protein
MALLCRHIMPNGTRCHSPVLRGTHFCYFHTRLHRFAAEKAQGKQEPIEIPVLEDRSAIQVALAQVLNGLASAKLDPRRAGLFLYGLQIASQNVQRNGDIVPMSAVSSLTLTSEGEELAPEKCLDAGPEDCADCESRDSCEDFVSDDEEEEDEDD